MHSIRVTAGIRWRVRQIFDVAVCYKEKNWSGEFERLQVLLPLYFSLT